MYTYTPIQTCMDPVARVLDDGMYIRICSYIPIFNYIILLRGRLPMVCIYISMYIHMHTYIPVPI